MLLALLLATQTWTVEADQALVSLEVSGISAVSHELKGSVRELEGGGVQVELSAASFDRLVKNDAPIVFEGTAQAGHDDSLRLSGTITLHGERRSLTLPVTLARVGGHAFAHAILTLHLRDFGFVLPDGASDLARLQIDAGLRPEQALASRG